MKPQIAAILLISLALATLPTASAQFGAGAQTSVADCRAFTTSSTVAVVDAGSIVFCSRAESRVSTSASGWRLGASLTTPRLSGASPSLTITLNALSGCTAGSPVVTGTAAGATFGAQTSSSWMMTMTSGQCSGYLRGTVTSGGTTVYDGVLDFGVMSADTPNYNVNSGGITVTDDANGWALTGIPTPPSALTVSGGLTVTDDANGWAIHQDEACGATVVCLSDSVSNVTLGAVNVTLGGMFTNNNSTVEESAGFWDLFGPLMLVALLVAVLPRAHVWLVPAGILAGLWVFFQAFQQPFSILVFFQLLAGAFLATFAIWQAALRKDEMTQQRQAGSKLRRFFNNE